VEDEKTNFEDILERFRIFSAQIRNNMEMIGWVQATGCILRTGDYRCVAKCYHAQDPNAPCTGICDVANRARAYNAAWWQHKPMPAVPMPTWRDGRAPWQFDGIKTVDEDGNEITRAKKPQAPEKNTCSGDCDTCGGH